MKITTIATLGGHSALEICLGAKKLGFKTIVIAQHGREKTYTQYFRNLVDDYILVMSFAQLTDKNITVELSQKSCVFIPHRYCQVYCNLKELENIFPIPVFGNKFLLKYEEREGAYNQYELMEKAYILYPKRFQNPKNIDRLVLIKVKEAKRHYERAFFFASTYKEYLSKSKELLATKKINKTDFDTAVIEEYLIGVQINFNFFYSPLMQKLELLGTDTRRQTNIDGIIRIPANEQREIEHLIYPSYIESGHSAVTVKESLLEKAFALAEKLLNSSKKIVPPGIIGPFALQTAILPGPPDEKIVVFDVSLRIPGSPGTSSTPYSQYHFGEDVSCGQRIAVEIKNALNQNRLKEVIT